MRELVRILNVYDAIVLKFNKSYTFEQSLENLEKLILGSMDFFNGAKIVGTSGVHLEDMQKDKLKVFLEKHIKNVSVESLEYIENPQKLIQERLKQRQKSKENLEKLPSKPQDTKIVKEKKDKNTSIFDRLINKVKKTQAQDNNSDNEKVETKTNKKAQNNQNLEKKEKHPIEKWYKEKLESEKQFLENSKREEEPKKTSGKNKLLENFKLDEFFEGDDDMDQTVFYRGTLRSGMRLESNSNIVVVGDVNPGAELYAKGNIIVMGILRGLAHAGNDGNADKIIVAWKLKAMHLRIADYITRALDGDDEDIDYPEIAVVVDGKFIIKSYQKLEE